MPLEPSVITNSPCSYAKPRLIRVLSISLMQRLFPVVLWMTSRGPFISDAQHNDHLFTCQVLAINKEGYLLFFLQRVLGKGLHCLSAVFNKMPADARCTQSKT